MPKIFAILAALSVNAGNHSLEIGFHYSPHPPPIAVPLRKGPTVIVRKPTWTAIKKETK